LFVQEENFYGILGWTMGESWLARVMGAEGGNEKRL
jgi:hypothetical protein